MEQKQIDQLEALAKRLDSSGIAQYVELSGRPWKILWLNFISGVARGLGFTVGTAIVLAVAYKVISRIISMNIPYLTEWLQEIIRMVQTQ